MSTREYKGCWIAKRVTHYRGIGTCKYYAVRRKDAEEKRFSLLRDAKKYVDNLGVEK